MENLVEVKKYLKKASISIPRWFLIGARIKPLEELRSLSEHLLTIYGHAFLPFATRCVPIPRRKSIICDYSNLAKQIITNMDFFKSYGEQIVVATLHTEYMAPIWFDAEFIDNYVKYTKQLIDLAVNLCPKLKVVEIEMHPGYSDHRGSRKPISSIIEGITEYMSRIYPSLANAGLSLRITIENRGSGSLRKPQAASNYNELLSFMKILSEKKIEAGFNIDIGLTIDPMQRLSPLKKRLKNTKRALKTLIIETYNYVRIRNIARNIHSIHAHWVNNKGIQHTPPTKEDMKEAVKFYQEIIVSVARENNIFYVVPEILPNYIRRYETYLFTKELADIMEKLTR